MGMGRGEGEGGRGEGHLRTDFVLCGILSLVGFYASLGKPIPWAFWA